MNPEIWQTVAIGLAVLLLLVAGGIGADGLLKKRLREALEERGRYENRMAARLAALQGWGTRDEPADDCDGCDG